MTHADLDDSPDSFGFAYLDLATRQLGGFAKALRRAAETLHEESQPNVARVTEGIASTLERACDRIVGGVVAAKVAAEQLSAEPSPSPSELDLADVPRPRFRGPRELHFDAIDDLEPANGRQTVVDGPIDRMLTRPIRSALEIPLIAE